MRKIHLNIIFFVTFIFLLPVSNILNIGKQSTGELENRVLHTFPEFSLQRLLSGIYFKEYEDYYSDNFTFRDSLVKTSKSVRGLWGLTNRDGIEIVQHHGKNVAELQYETENAEEAHKSLDAKVVINEKKDKSINGESSEKGVETEINEESKRQDVDKKSDNSVSSKDTGTKVGSMLVLNDMAMEICNPDKEACAFYSGTINLFRERLGGNTKIYSLLAPTAIEFIDNERLKSATYSQKEAIEIVNEGFDKSIIPVNAYAQMNRNKGKYMHFRTDHHWTALGAYYAYTGFMQARNEEPVPLDRYETGRIEGFLGSTYSATLNKKLQGHPDTIVYYKPYIKHQYHVFYQGPLKMDLLDMSHATQKNKYRIFLSGDRPWGRIVTEVGNNKKIVVIKDSYANAFIPFLLPHYKEIYTVDPRQFKMNILAFIKEKEIQEVLFLNYVSVTESHYFADLIRNMMNK